MNIKNITVFGSGVLGAQIAFQCAFHGYQVTLYDINDGLLNAAKKKFISLADSYRQDLNASEKQLEEAYGKLSYTADLAESVKDADMTIEAISENVQLKKDFYSQLGKLAPEKTIFCTNSSTFLPSQFAVESGRPDRFLALHFANLIWKYNTAEIMGHPGTDPAIFKTVVAFAKTIGMVALPIYKEQPGYILNSLMVPFFMAALDLYFDEVADIEAIDKTWMVATGAPRGPFAMLDIIGLTTTYNIYKIYGETTGKIISQQGAGMLKKNYVDENKLGVLTGEGFYKYPNPSFQSPSFLK